MSMVIASERAEAGASEAVAPAPGATDWARAMVPYRDADALRGTFELVVTAVPFALCWVAMLGAVATGHAWLAALLLLPAAGLLVRLFMIQHDCGHGAFFPSRTANDWTGRVISVLTLTPYDYWKRSHAIHHAGSGNLDRRGIGDIDTITVREYRARSAWGRLAYRLYRHPLVMFGLGPVYLFVLQSRLPFGFMRRGWAPWISTQGTNLAVAAVFALAAWAAGPWAFLAVHLPIVLLAATIGVWLFYVQHQFEGTRWDRTGDWNLQDAALHGSSHYDLPPVLRWFTANIGMHHVHHLSSRIPFYRLPEVLRDHPALRDIGRLTLRESLGCVRLALWDEDRRRLISFSDLGRLPA